MNLDLDKINPRKVRPTGERVLLYRQNVKEIDGLAVPQQAAEAWRWNVIAVGEEVKHLKPGDVVYVGGTQYEQDFAKVPCCRDIYITAEKNVLVVVGNPPPITCGQDAGKAYDKILES